MSAYVITKLLANQLRMSKPGRIPDSRGRYAYTSYLEQLHRPTVGIPDGSNFSLEGRYTRERNSSHLAMIVSTALVHCGGIFTELHLSLVALKAFT